MKQSQKRIIEINHALSGIHGQEMKSTAFHINQTRKEILKKIDRKKKLSSIIHDQLYSYLEKFPEEKAGLHQELKKKKLKLAEYEEKCPYKSVSFNEPTVRLLSKKPDEEAEEIMQFLKYAWNAREKEDQNYI